MTQLPTLGKQPVAPKKKEQTGDTVKTPMSFDEQVSEEVTEIEAEYSRYFGTADELLRKIATEKRAPRFAELSFFKSRCLWDDAEIRRQINRITSVIRGQLIAGSQSDRDAADAENEKSHEILNAQKPKIEQEITALQERLSGLDRSANRAERRCEEIDCAVSDLKKLLRQDLEEKYNTHFASIVGEFAKIGELTTEVSHREVCLNPAPDMFNDRQRFYSMLQMYYPDCVERKENHGGRLEFSEPAWTLRKITMAIELELMRVELETLQMQKRFRLESIEPILDFYLMETK